MVPKNLDQTALNTQEETPTRGPFDFIYGTDAERLDMEQEDVTSKAMEAF